MEAATGVEIIVDDTPEAIVLSAFDPVRREIARLSLHQLVTDGRIHPARIEEVVNKVQKQIEEEIVEVGKRTAIDLGIHGLHPELVRLVGKMKYRSSYGQNLLQHSREVANLSATMASELGLNPNAAKRRIITRHWKVPDDEPKYHTQSLVCGWLKIQRKAPGLQCTGAHHDEIEMESLLAPIVRFVMLFREQDPERDAKLWKLISSALKTLKVSQHNIRALLNPMPCKPVENCA